MKLIIAGSRTFTNYQALKEKADLMLHGQTDIIIVSGMAKEGADLLAVEYAEEKGYPLKPFYPDWNKYGKAAGPIRNQQMAEYADALLAFWDGKSPGTNDMICKALAFIKYKAGPTIRVYSFDKQQQLKEFIV